MEVGDRVQLYYLTKGICYDCQQPLVDCKCEEDLPSEIQQEIELAIQRSINITPLDFPCDYPRDN